LVGKNTENTVNSELYVDSWKVEYQENPNTGEDDLIETYMGPTPIKMTAQQKYLGFVLSSIGDNMANISQIKKKSIGTVRKIMNRLNSLNLQKYYFECAAVLMNSMLRGSILYACEMYYNLKEGELRQIERIEEGYLRKVFKTTKGCPITQLYLEIGQVPARFEIQKMRLLYLKCILEESDDSLLRKFFQLQLNEPTRGDWASKCLQDLKELKISESLDEIRCMSKAKFNNILKSRVRENALLYLKGKQKSKGKEIMYCDIEMAEYLLPSNNTLNIVQKQKLFAVRNRMIEISSNFCSSDIIHACVCGEAENMKHIYICKLLNEGKEPKDEYENIFNGIITMQLEIFQKFENNMRKYEVIKNAIKTETELKTPCDPCDPLFFNRVVMD
jgi:hypothetical protein